MIQEEFREYLCGYRTVRFHFRLQKEAARYYRDRKARRNGFSNLCVAALDRFQQALSQGLIKIERTSRFREREDVEDKIECIAVLDVRAKDFLEKLAFALRLSQAEVLRSALEWWREAILMREVREVSTPARRKWHHRGRVLHVESLSFSFWDFGRELYWRFPSKDRKLFPFPMQFRT